MSDCEYVKMLTNAVISIPPCIFRQVLRKGLRHRSLLNKMSNLMGYAWQDKVGPMVYKSLVLLGHIPAVVFSLQILSLRTAQNNLRHL